MKTEKSECLRMLNEANNKLENIADGLSGYAQDGAIGGHTLIVCNAAIARRIIRDAKNKLTELIQDAKG